MILRALILVTISVNLYSKDFQSEGMSLKLELVKGGLEIPWGIDFIDSNQMLFTERKGKLKVLNLKTKKVTEIKGVPKVYASGQGGLLDVAIHSETKEIYLSFSHRENSKNTTRVIKAKLKDNKLIEQKIVFTARPFFQTTHHYGSRITFVGSDVYISVGDRGQRELAQKLDKNNGKIIKVDQNGKVSTHSYGHRNPQGLFYDKKREVLFEGEHGPRGGDEINIIKEKVNYGWPIATYGREYYGLKIGSTHKKGTKQPLKHYVPSIAPSGLIVYQSDYLEKWQGSIFQGALVLKHLNRVVLNKNLKPIKEERLFEDMDERIRNVKEGPKGRLYFSTDSGNIYKITKK